MSASESRSGIVLELAEEFLESYRQGQRPSLKEYIDRHPELAAEIKEVFPAMVLMENIALADESLAGDPTGEAAAIAQAPPEQLGDFRILREVGRGGMGIVYEAEQVSLGRHVALKVLPRKVLLDAQQKRRFEREAKAAAKLHHTNIVPVFGVGEQDGLPYYVMQFIQGLGLDEVCEELKQMRSGEQVRSARGEALPATRKDVSAADVARSLLTGAFSEGEPAALAAGLGTLQPAANAVGSPQSSSSVNLPGSDASPGRVNKSNFWQSVARMGVQVADALEYAHKQGIQHRDIKPSNLLLDTAGTVWVTDFGLAQRENEDHLTQTGDIVGTLRYMPPEAFEGRTDARSDLYSLGLTLYELLALRPAFAERERHKLIKQVTTEEPARLDKLNRSIPRDLVTIVRKAIDREPSRRYPSADELAADLQRFIEDEPIQARRISNGERLLRWCRRHPGVASLTAVLVLILVGVTLASLLAAARFDWLAQEQATAAANERQARQEADEAAEHETALRKQAVEAKNQAETNLRESERQKQRAESNFAKARKAVDDYFTTVSESQLLQVSGMQPLRRDLLQSALTFYQNFLKERGDDPTLRGELAAAYLRVGKIRGELGENAEARKAHEQALELYQALSKAAPESVEWRHGLAQCYYRLGRFDEAIALWQKLVQPGQLRFQRELADAYNFRANRFMRTNRLAEALQGRQQALAIHERLVRLNPDDPDARRELGRTLFHIGWLLVKKERLAEALTMYRRAAEHAEAAFAQAPQAFENQFLALCHLNIAYLEGRLVHEQEALAAYWRCIEVWRKLARDNPAVPSMHSGLFQAYCYLAWYERELKHTEQEKRIMNLAREVGDRLPSDGPVELYNLACFRSLNAASFRPGNEKPTAEEKAEQKRELDLAMEALRKAIAAGFRDLDLFRRDTDLNALRRREDFKALEADLAARLAAAPADKLKANQQALALHQKAVQADPKNKRLQADLAASQHAIALIQLDLGKRDEAQKHLQQAIALREALVKDEPKNAQYQTDLALSRFALGDINWQIGRLAEAAKSWQQQLNTLETAARPGRDRSSLTHQLLAMRRTVGRHYARAGLWSEAVLQYSRLISLEGATDYDYLVAAALALRAGNADAYRRACTAMVQRLGDTEDAVRCCHLAQACNLAENAGIEPARLLLWAGKGRAMKPPVAEWVYHEFGLAHYRAGQFAEAIVQANKSDTLNPNWPGHIRNWPVLAMAHQRLGHAAEARQWLDKSTAEWRRLSPLTRFLDDTTVLPSAPGLVWYDWPLFEILLREASLLIAGALPMEDAFDHAHQSLLYSRLGAREKAETEWQAAIKMSPREPALWLARGRAFAQLGQHDKADADFAKASALTPDELDRFPQAGWWVVGPYPEDLHLSCPPEKDPDPSRPISAVGSAAELHWRPAPTDPDGRVRLRQIFNADHISAYALTYVYSPDERTATLLAGGDGRVRVWLNGRLVHETTRRTAWAGDLDRVPVTLKAGRNILLCKIGQDTGPHNLHLRIADNPLDRALLHASLGLWDEAAAEFARGIDQQFNAFPEHFVRCAHARLLVGNTAGYRHYVARMFERYDKDSPPHAWLAYAGVLLDGAVKAARLVELVEHDLERDKHPWHPHVAGLAYYRAGQFEKAIERLEESLKNPGWQSNQGHAAELGIALAHHRLGHAKEARQWLDKDEQWYDKAVKDALASPTATANLYWWADWPNFVVLRREAHKRILGKDLPDDPRLKKLTDRMRDWLKKLDKTTADYDVAIFLSPNEPRLWLARGQRLRELKRDKEAEADFAKAQTLIDGAKDKPKK